MSNDNFLFKLPVVITKQGNRFVAYTPALDISTSGKSEKEVRSRFEELANIFFEEIVEEGTLQDVLTELGWKRAQKKWAPPEVVSSSSIGFRIQALV